MLHFKGFGTGTCGMTKIFNKWKNLHPIVSNKIDNLMSFKEFVEEFGGL